MDDTSKNSMNSAVGSIVAGTVGGGTVALIWAITGDMGLAALGTAVASTAGPLIIIGTGLEDSVRCAHVCRAAGYSSCAWRTLLTGRHARVRISGDPRRATDLRGALQVELRTTQIGRATTLKHRWAAEW